MNCPHFRRTPAGMESAQHQNLTSQNHLRKMKMLATAQRTSKPLRPKSQWIT